MPHISALLLPLITAIVAAFNGLPRAFVGIAEQSRLREHDRLEQARLKELDRLEHKSLIHIVDKHGPDSECALRLIDVMEKGRGISP